MADISKITLPSGTIYNIKDAWARDQIAAITGGNAIVFKGVSSTALTDGGDEDPTVNGVVITAKDTGDLYFYLYEEFIYGDDEQWHSLGGPQQGIFGDLAYKNDASATYTPAGSVSVSVATTENKTATVSKAVSGTTTYTPEGSVTAPTISVNTAGSTTTIHNPTKATVAKAVVAAAPGETAPSNALIYYSVANETLSLYQLGYTTGDSITTSDVTVKTGDASYVATAPSFTGTGARLVTENIPVPATYSGTFAGTEATITVS